MMIWEKNEITKQLEFYISLKFFKSHSVPVFKPQVDPSSSRKTLISAVSKEQTLKRNFYKSSLKIASEEKF